MRIRRGDAGDLDRLFDIWLQSVRVTHDFVAPEDIEAFKPMVRDYLATAPDVWVVEDERGRAMGFMGMTGSKMDALFLSPEYQGRGAGRSLVEHAHSLYGEITVDVNEQNAPARRFYERCGFVVEGRSPLDDSGRPYPLLHMRSSRRR